MLNLLSNFPEGYTPNKSQIAILKRIDDALVSEKKFIIVNAPTGVGKSFLPKTLANLVGGPSNNYKSIVDDYSIFSVDGAELASGEKPFGCYALTITKTLQDQYKDTFEDTGILKGQSNYQCKIDEGVSVDIAPCLYVEGLKPDCWRKNLCPYYNNRNSMLKSAFSSLNYSMFFSLPNHLKRRKFLVCDEASELEEQLVGQFTCEIDLPFLIKCNVDVKSFPSSPTPAKAIDWLNQLHTELGETLSEYLKYFKDNPKKNNPSDFNKKKSEYTKINNLFSSVDLLIATYHDSQYLIERIEKSIHKVLQEGMHLTRDLGGNSSTTEYTKAIIKYL